MWKAFSRYVKEPLERKLALRKNRKEAQENNCANTQLSCFCQFGPKHLFNKNESCWEETNQNKNRNDSAFIRDQHFWLEAAGLGSVFGFGWVISQNLYLRQKHLIDEKWNEYNKRFSFLRSFLSKKTLLAHPGDEIKSIEGLNKEYPCDEDGHVFGPKTSEEAIAEAADGLISAHNDAIAAMENRIGVRLMNKKRYRKAVTHFSAASTLNNASAMFNLAQCYELGLGTKQDFKKAAHYYQTASNLGHADATYNLGLFYTHGWGGLPFNNIEAKRLFEKAAELGQPDAKAIIDLRNDEPPSLCYQNDYYYNRNDSNKNITDISYVIESIKNLSVLGSNEQQNNHKNFVKCKSSSTESTGYSSSSGNGILSVYSNSSSFSSWSSEEADHCNQSVADNFSGICYENGIGVKRDLDKAVSLYTTAAYNGSSEALYNLAASYEATMPLEGNWHQTELLVELYRIAARHGHKYAEERLKKLEVFHEFGILADYLKKSRKT